MSRTAAPPGRGPRRRRSIAPFVGALVGLGLIAALAAAQAPPPPAALRTEVQAQPIGAFDVRHPWQRHFGGLEFRGGLVLRSSARNFGGISGFRVLADGALFLAITDRAWWLRGRLLYDGLRPVAVADAEMAPMLAANGQTLLKRGWYDTEAMEENGGIVHVALERVHQIVRFNYGRDGLNARAQPLGAPPGMRSLAPNRGIESLVLVRKGLPLAGTLIAISERGLEKDADAPGFLIGGPQPGVFTVRRVADFDISDAALLPGGDLLLLERRLSWTSGLSVRLRRISLKDIVPSAVVDGPVLLEADLGYEIDNMEALSVHRSGGDTVLTLVSDDNFSLLQRTLLLQFTLTVP